jgi:glucose-6-phosphate dehydrogenase assembly protein OpcA
MADKLILDSAEIKSLWMFGGRAIDSSARVALHELTRIAEAGAGAGAMLGDLAWTRLTRWRESVAQIFQSRANRADLENLEQVSVVTNQEPGVSAFYLGAWVMDSLAAIGMTPRFRIERNGESALALRMTAPELSVDVEVRDDRMVSKVNGLSNCAKMPEATEYALMKEELSVMRRDRAFERTLPSAARLAAGVRQ